MQSFSEGGGDHKIRNFYIQLNKDYIHQPFTTQKSPRFESIRIDRYFRLVLISITDKPDRNASPNLIGRNVLVHHGTRPDDSTVTDCHRFCEYGIASDIYIPPNMNFTPVIGMLFQIPDIIIMRKQNASIRNSRPLPDKNIFWMNRINRNPTDPNYTFFNRNA